MRGTRTSTVSPSLLRESSRLAPDSQVASPKITSAALWAHPKAGSAPKKNAGWGIARQGHGQRLLETAQSREGKPLPRDSGGSPEVPEDEAGKSPRFPPVAALAPAGDLSGRRTTIKFNVPLTDSPEEDKHRSSSAFLPVASLASECGDSGRRPTLRFKMPLPRDSTGLPGEEEDGGRSSSIFVPVATLDSAPNGGDSGRRPTLRFKEQQHSAAIPEEAESKDSLSPRVAPLPALSIAAGGEDGGSYHRSPTLRFNVPMARGSADSPEQQEAKDRSSSRFLPVAALGLIPGLAAITRRPTRKFQDVFAGNKVSGLPRSSTTGMGQPSLSRSLSQKFATAAGRVKQAASWASMLSRSGRGLGGLTPAQQARLVKAKQQRQRLFSAEQQVRV